MFVYTKLKGLEDVKKLICSGFLDFIFDPKCLLTPQQSFIRHPGAIFLTPSLPQILKSIFSHLPDGSDPKANPTVCETATPLPTLLIRFMGLGQERENTWEPTGDERYPIKGCLRLTSPSLRRHFRDRRSNHHPFPSRERVAS